MSFAIFFRVIFTKTIKLTLIKEFAFYSFVICSWPTLTSRWHSLLLLLEAWVLSWHPTHLMSPTLMESLVATSSTSTSKVLLGSWEWWLHWLGSNFKKFWSNWLQLNNIWKLTNNYYIVHWSQFLIAMSKMTFISHLTIMMLLKMSASGSFIL